MERPSIELLIRFQFSIFCQRKGRQKKARLISRVYGVPAVDPCSVFFSGAVGLDEYIEILSVWLQKIEVMLLTDAEKMKEVPVS